MAKLILKEFRCVVDTDESGDESPYFVTWVGNLRHRGNGGQVVAPGVLGEQGLAGADVTTAS